MLKQKLYELKLLFRSIPSLVLTLYVLSVICMNLLANKSINTYKLSWIALDCGTLVSWVAFMMMDIIVVRFGARAGTNVAIITSIINLAVSVLFFVAAKIPGVWSASFDYSGDIDYALDATFGGTWYILLGSTVAFILGSIVNNCLNSAFGKCFKNTDTFGKFAVRSYVSTIIGQFTDNFVFSAIVSHTFFGWTWVQCVTGSIVLAVIELVLEIALSPICYKVYNKWEKDNVGYEYLKYIQENK